MRKRQLAGGSLIAIMLLWSFQLEPAAICAAAELDDTPPGVALPSSPVMATLDLVDPESPVDSDDWYWIDLSEGDRLKLQVDPGDVVNWVDLYSEDSTAPAQAVSAANAPVWRFTHFVPSGSGGTYLLHVSGLHRHEVAGPYALEWSVDRNPYTVSRVQGADRYETALEFSRSLYATGSVESAIVATGERFPDALCAAGLSGALDQAPILLTRGDTLTEGIIEELSRLGVSTVYIIGGDAAISADIESMIAQQPGVSTRRLAGSDRYDTSVRIADEVDSIMGEFAFNAFVVRGDGFADAASCAYAAALHGFPVLLVPHDKMNHDTAAAIVGPQVDPRSRVTIVGGTAAVGTAIQIEIDSLLTDDAEFERFCVRIGGRDRYETSALVARQYAPPNTAALTLATGASFPDALDAGSAMAHAGGAVLLVGPAGLHLESTLSAFRTVVDPGVDVFLAGGAAVISADVASQAERELGLLFGDH